MSFITQSTFASAQMTFAQSWAASSGDMMNVSRRLWHRELMKYLSFQKNAPQNLSCLFERSLESFCCKSYKGQVEELVTLILKPSVDIRPIMKLVTYPKPAHHYLYFYTDYDDFHDAEYTSNEVMSDCACAIGEMWLGVNGKNTLDKSDDYDLNSNWNWKLKDSETFAHLIMWIEVMSLKWEGDIKKLLWSTDLSDAPSTIHRLYPWFT